MSDVSGLNGPITPPLRILKPGEKSNGNGGTFDPWASETQGTYDQDSFYVKSTDGKGNSETVYGKYPPSVLATVAELVASRRVPAYRTPADFFRDAAVHRLKHVAGMIKSGTLEADVNRYIMLDRISSRQQELADLNAIIRHHEEAMQTCVNESDWMLLDVLLSDAEADYEHVRPAYKTKIGKLILDYRRRLDDSGYIREQ